MGLVVGFGWVKNVIVFDNIVGLVVGRMVTKLVGVGHSNTSGQTQIVSL